MSNMFSNVSGVPFNGLVRPLKISDSYTAVFRLAEAAARLDQTFTQVANTNKQWATLHHIAGSLRTVTLTKCLCQITAWSLATQGVLELRQINSAPATGNPTITPTRHNNLQTPVESSCFYLPTTQATETNVNSPLAHIPFDLGIMGLASTANPMVTDRIFTLYNSADEDIEASRPTLTAGILSGLAVVLRTVGAPAVRMTVVMKFIEE